MTVFAYPEYRESGVEWLGRVPRHWSVVPLKRTLKLVTDRAVDRSFPVALENIEGWTGRFLSREATYEGEGTAFKKGDLLFGKLRPYLAKVWASDRGGEAVGDIHVLRPTEANVPAYLQRFLLTREAISLIDGATQGAKMPRASWDFMGSLAIALPSAEEQSAIAAFLDRESGKIDALVAEQERLIALSKEKRQAVISHAVTKGLNPDVSMKDSGIPWLGKVPAHWQVKPIKHCLRSLDQGWSPQCEGYPVDSPEEWGVLKVGCVNGGMFDKGQNKKLPHDLDGINELTVEQGDVLISRANTRDLVGSAALVPQKYSRLMLSDKLYRLRTKDVTCSPNFLTFYLNSRVARGQIELKAGGASQSMLNISQDVIADMHMPLPPVLEQNALTTRLSASLQTIDILSAQATRAITLLRERRAALISAAVTGKIDVRDTAPATQAAA